MVVSESGEEVLLPAKIPRPCLKGLKKKKNIARHSELRCDRYP